MLLNNSAIVVPNRIGVGGVQVAGGAEFSAGLSANPVNTGIIQVESNGKVSFVGHGAAAPAAMFVNAGGLVTLGPGQKLRVVGNMNLSGEFTINGNRSVFDGDAELQVGGTGSQLAMSGAARLTVNDAALRLPNGMTQTSTSALLFGGSLNDVYGTIDSAGSLGVGSGVNLFHGMVHSTGQAALLFDSQSTFFGDFEQYGDLTVGNVLNPDLPTTASATFRNTYRGLGATGGGQLVFQNYLSPQTATNPTATATFNNNVILSSSAKLVLRLGGGMAGTDFSRLVVSRELRLGGELQVVDLGGAALSVGATFDLLDWGSLAGSFSSMFLPGLAPGRAWDTSHLYTTGVLQVVAAPLAGDYNATGVVDAADYVVWRKGLGITYSQPDYGIWRAHFGETAGSGLGASATAAVPEPASFALLIFAAAGLYVRRGRSA
jgi:hypothetical protein